jgi:hypothetical protein
LLFVENTENAIHVLVPVAHYGSKLMLHRGKLQFLGVSERNHAKFLVRFDHHFWFASFEEASL